MVLRSEESRVLGCLVEKEATVPDSYPLTLNALRLACNQASNRRPVVSYDDRTVEQALVSLKSMGLVRFVHPAHGGRTIRYRHCADERWRLSPAELAVLAVLVLRGPQTAAEVRARADHRLADGDATVEEVLDTLVNRGPEPLATRLERRPGEREARFAHLLGGTVEQDDGGDAPEAPALVTDPPPTTRDAGDPLVAEVAALRARLDRLEALLGVDPLDPVDSDDVTGPR